jgi:hypothetical protein
MIVTAWNNGSHHTSGAGYDIKIEEADRDCYFNPLRANILLELAGTDTTIEVNTAKASFWNPTCRELIHKDIGKWRLANRLAPWHKGRPPKLELTPLGENHFRLELK